MISRRDFLKISAVVGTSALITARFRGVTRVFAAPIPGGTLDPFAVTKYATPLLIPPVMPKAGVNKGVDYYEISMKQITQQILPAGLPATTVWGYGAVTGMGKKTAADSQRALADH